MLVTSEYTREISNLADSGINHKDTVHGVTLDWTDPKLKRITRIRFIGDSWSGPFDLSYVLGEDDQGRQVHVRIPLYQVMGKGGTIKGELIAEARRDKVWLTGLCGGSIDSALSVMW